MPHSHGYALEVRFAALAHDLGKATTPQDILPRHIGHEARSVELLHGLCERLRVPNECRDLALLVARYHGDVHRAQTVARGHHRETVPELRCVAQAGAFHAPATGVCLGCARAHRT